MTGMVRIWKFGDDIDTDALAPGQYMNAPLDQLSAHCLESVNAGFAVNVKPGDIIAAGFNFGTGSSREQAAQALRHLGVSAVIAKSFAGIFYRNAINLGLPVFECADTDQIRDGDTAELDLAQAKLVVAGDADPIACQPIPGFLMQILADGGLVPHLEKRFSAGKI